MFFHHKEDAGGREQTNSAQASHASPRIAYSRTPHTVTCTAEQCKRMVLLEFSFSSCEFERTRTYMNAQHIHTFYVIFSLYLFIRFFRFILIVSRLCCIQFTNSHI